MKNILLFTAMAILLLTAPSCSGRRTASNEVVYSERASLRPEAAEITVEPAPVEVEVDDDDDSGGKGLFGILGDIIALPFRLLSALF